MNESNTTIGYHPAAWLGVISMVMMCYIAFQMSVGAYKLHNQNMIIPEWLFIGMMILGNIMIWCLTIVTTYRVATGKDNLFSA